MKIQIYAGKFNETTTTSNNLRDNQQKMPVIRDIIEYTEPRMLSTLIVSGSRRPWELLNTNQAKAKISKIPAADLIGDNAYRYNVQGRIQQSSNIVAQVGTSGANGSFQLQMEDNYLTPGMIAVFYDQSVHARVMGVPSGSQGNFVYSFQTMNSLPFVFATAVAIQPGQQTCFGGSTAFGENSYRGYSRSHFPDQFVNHLTIQRKTCAISGGAMTDVLWVSFNGMKGWMYQKEVQGRLQFMMEDEFAKWFGKSSMKDANGNLLVNSGVIDPETGNPIVTGDGLIPQIEGGNEAFTSGTEGEVTITDFKDMMQTLEKKSNSVYNKIWYVVTGTEGYGTAQDILQQYYVNDLGGRVNAGLNNAAGVGGQDINVGGNFDTFNVAGNTIVLVKHTFFDDEQKFPRRNGFGKLIQSNLFVFLDMGSNAAGTSNIEIKSKGAYGINRSMVTAYINGLTGAEGNVVSSVDAKSYEMLKEDGIFIYNTTSCGLLRMPTA